ncbi:hypothetical protein HDU96_005126 [Phlyctochytrium bullatum]|nr:hypothetical protein HDU96_005126 [Phlyctochytrium bullatum]
MVPQPTLPRPLTGAFLHRLPAELLTSVLVQLGDIHVAICVEISLLLASRRSPVPLNNGSPPKPKEAPPLPFLRINLANVPTSNFPASSRLARSVLSLHELHAATVAHEVVAWFLRYRPDVFTYAFSTAVAEAGRLEVLAALFRAGIDRFSCRMLNAAAGAGHLDVIRFLLRRASDQTLPVEFSGGVCTTEAMNSAAASGHLEVVKFLHDNFQEGCTEDAMHRAACNGHLDVLRFLHQVRDEAPQRGTLTKACRRAGNVAVIRYLHEVLEEDITPSAVHEAAVIGDLEIVRYLFPRCHDESVSLSVSSACGAGHFDVVKYLLSTSRQFDMVQNGNDGPGIDSMLLEGIKSAAKNGHLDMVRYLVEEELRLTRLGTMSPLTFHVIADTPDAKYRRYIDSHLSSAATLAAGGGHLEVIHYLSDFAHLTFSERTVYLAAGSGNLDLLRYLINRGTSVSSKALLNACFYNQLEVIRFLLESPAPAPDLEEVPENLEPVDPSASPPPPPPRRLRLTHVHPNLLRFAVTRGHLSIVQYLLERGLCSPLEIRSNEMVYVARKGKLDVLQYLHQEHPNLDAWTPNVMEEAAAWGHIDIVRFLHSHHPDWASGTEIMASAVGNGHVDVLRFLLDCRRAAASGNGSEGSPAAPGHPSPTASVGSSSSTASASTVPGRFTELRAGPNAHRDRLHDVVKLLLSQGATAAAASPSTAASTPASAVPGTALAPLRFELKSASSLDVMRLLCENAADGSAASSSSAAGSPQQAWPGGWSVMQPFDSIAVLPHPGFAPPPTDFQDAFPPPLHHPPFILPATPSDAASTASSTLSSFFSDFLPPWTYPVDQAGFLLRKYFSNPTFLHPAPPSPGAVAALDEEDGDAAPSFMPTPMPLAFGELDMAVHVLTAAADIDRLRLLVQWYEGCGLPAFALPRAKRDGGRVRRADRVPDEAGEAPDTGDRPATPTPAPSPLDLAVPPHLQVAVEPGAAWSNPVAPTPPAPLVSLPSLCTAITGAALGGCLAFLRFLKRAAPPAAFAAAMEEAFPDAVKGAAGEGHVKVVRELLCAFCAEGEKVEEMVRRRPREMVWLREACVRAAREGRVAMVRALFPLARGLPAGPPASVPARRMRGWGRPRGGAVSGDEGEASLAAGEKEAPVAMTPAPAEAYRAPPPACCETWVRSGDETAGSALMEELVAAAAGKGNLGVLTLMLVEGDPDFGEGERVKASRMVPGLLRSAMAEATARWQNRTLRVLIQMLLDAHGGARLGDGMLVDGMAQDTAEGTGSTVEGCWAVRILQDTLNIVPRSHVFSGSLVTLLEEAMVAVRCGGR